jgi:hypothetical protein
MIERQKLQKIMAENDQNLTWLMAEYGEELEQFAHGIVNTETIPVARCLISLTLSNRCAGIVLSGGKQYEPTPFFRFRHRQDQRQQNRLYQQKDRQADYNVGEQGADYGTGRNANVLKDWAKDAKPTAKPDLLKLGRAVEDAMSGIIYRDDSQIVEEALLKHYGDKPGVDIIIEKITGE